jgi:hypothetical protein
MFPPFEPVFLPFVAIRRLRRFRPAGGLILI